MLVQSMMISSAIFLLALGIVGANPHRWGMQHGPNYPAQNFPGPNYPGQNFPGPNYPGQNFPGPNYPGQNFPGPNYPGQNVPGPNYPGQNSPDGRGHYSEEQINRPGQNFPEVLSYPQSDVNPQQSQDHTGEQLLDPYMEKPKVKLLQGTIDDVKNMNTQWICTNQKTGDTMLIGSIDGTGNILGPKSQQLKASTFPSQWVTTEEPKSAKSIRNPGFIEVVSPGFTKPMKSPLTSPQTATQDPLDKFDWAAYIKTANCSVPTPLPVPVPTRVPEFDGTGIIQPRIQN